MNKLKDTKGNEQEPKVNEQQPPPTEQADAAGGQQEGHVLGSKDMARKKSLFLNTGTEGGHGGHGGEKQAAAADQSPARDSQNAATARRREEDNR